MRSARQTTAEPPLAITLQWRIRTPFRGQARLIDAARAAAAHQRLRYGHLSLTVVGRTAMRTLHRVHMGIDTPTDVLTFDLGGDPRRGFIDGEIVACADVARQAAARLGVTPLAELALYAVHGVLHLAGFDDHTAKDAARMHALEDEILSACGMGVVYAARRRR